MEKYYSHRNVLVVTDRPGMYLFHRWSSVGIPYANENAVDLISKLNKRLFEEIVMVQRISYLNDQADADTELKPPFRMDPIFETKLNEESYLRFSRVARWKDLSAKETPPG